MIALLLFFNLLIANAQNAAPDLKELRSAIKENQANWEASDVWLKKQKDLRRLLGDTGPAAEPNAITFDIPDNELDEALPEKFDWREVKGANYVTPVLNQGNCGSCVAASTIGTLETQVNITIPFSLPKFSMQSLFSCAWGRCDHGMVFDDAISHLETVGVPDEACLPYASGITGKDVTCGKCRNHDNRLFKVLQTRRPTRWSVNLSEIKKALLRGPVLTRMTVYNDFFAYYRGVYKHSYGEVAGGHGISLIGYDDAERAWHAKNSWGPDWGDSGFVKISYDDTSGVGDETWQFDVPAAVGHVRILNPQNKTFIEKTHLVHVQTTYPDLKSLNATVLNRSDEVIAELKCESNECQLPFDTSKLKDGRYEVFAVAEWGQDQKSESQHEYFYVANHPSEIQISFSGKGVDLSQPLSGRIELDILADAGGLPLSSIDVVVAQGDQVHYRRGTDNVASTMTASWRTVTVPDGEYDLYIEGILIIGDKTYQSQSTKQKVVVKNGVTQ